MSVYRLVADEIRYTDRRAAIAWGLRLKVVTVRISTSRRLTAVR